MLEAINTTMRLAPPSDRTARLADFIASTPASRSIQFLHEGPANPSTSPCPLFVKFVRRLARPQTQRGFYNYRGRSTYRPGNQKTWLVIGRTEACVILLTTGH